MNGKVAKFIRKYAETAGIPSRVIKDYWNGVPRPYRHALKVSSEQWIQERQQQKASTSPGQTLSVESSVK